MSEILIQGKNICKYFSKNDCGSKIFDGLNIDIYENDFTVIMGPSGAGKSTLLYTLSGMDTVTSGSIKYRGAELPQLSEKKLAALRAEEFGFVFQQTHLVSNLTLFENVAVAGYAGNKLPEKQVPLRTAELLAQLRVKNAAERIPAQTSGGEAQRAAIARAIINEPSILFADEPTGALNKSNTDEVLNIFTALYQNGQSILMVTHDIRCALRGNRILYLEDGAILDELSLPPFATANEKERQLTVSEWLAKLQW